MCLLVCWFLVFWGICWARGPALECPKKLVAFKWLAHLSLYPRFTRLRFFEYFLFCRFDCALQRPQTTKWMPLPVFDLNNGPTTQIQRPLQRSLNRNYHYRTNTSTTNTTTTAATTLTKPAPQPLRPFEPQMPLPPSPKLKQPPRPHKSFQYHGHHHDGHY